MDGLLNVPMIGCKCLPIVNEYITSITPKSAVTNKDDLRTTELNKILFAKNVFIVTNNAMIMGHTYSP
jgi:hypothetical protein